MVFDHYEPFGYHDRRLVIDDPVVQRAQRKWEVAIGYRIFAALRWGHLGDGHISARDPERLDHFWVLAHGVPFAAATVDLLVLIGPDGTVVEGPDAGGVNFAAHHIHTPILAARPDLVSAAHTHTQFGTPWSATLEPFRAITQESCAFVFDQVVYLGENLEVDELAGGEAIAAALGSRTLCILRNHGLLTVGCSVADAVGAFVAAERVAEAHVKAPAGVAISDEAAHDVADSLGLTDYGWRIFQWLARTHVPDPSAVRST